MERSMIALGLKEWVRKDEMRRRGVDDLTVRITKLKIRWAGHIARLNDGRWTERDKSRLMKNECDPS